MKGRLFFCSLACFYFSHFGGVLMAQSYLAVIDRIVEKSIENDDEISLDDTYEDLLRLAESPFNINTCTREELEQLFFLSPFQIESLLYYRYSFGTIYTLYELQLVEGFDDETAHFLLPFVYVDASVQEPSSLSLANAFRYGKQQLLARTDYTLQKKVGYTPLATPSNRYLGNPFYTQLRYQYSSKFVSLGVSMEKDAGEPFDFVQNKGFDFYSAHAFVSSLWKFKHLAIGQYKLNFGQGLVVQSSPRFGRSSIFSNTLYGEGISKSASVSEFDYFRGIAATFVQDKWMISSFYSHTPIDGTIELDENAQPTISSIKTDGLHRTESDFEKKHLAYQTVAGGNVHYQFPFIKIGATAVSYQLDKPLIPSVKPYNMYYFSGTHHYNVGIDYRARIHQFQLAGEIALDKNTAFAQLHSLAFQPISRFGLTALYRHYAPNYVAPLAKAYMQNSSSSNEEGLFLGTEILPFKKWKVTAYLDVFSFPWLRYLVNAPSQGYQGFLQTQYMPNRNATFLVQYKTSSKQQNMGEEDSPAPMLGTANKQEWRMQMDVKMLHRIFLKTAVQTTHFDTDVQSSTYGLLMYQDVGYEFANPALSLYVRYSIFDAENYDNRLYAYERDVLYAFAVPMYYGQGRRVYLNLRYKPMPALSCYFKIAHTYYTNRQEIGSGGETIAGNRKTDVRLLLNWRF